MRPVIPYVIAAVLFGLGIYGVAVRRNAVLVLMAVELLLNAVNLIFVTADASLPGVPRDGQVFALFVIVLAAAEIGVGLAIVLRLFRATSTVDTDVVDRSADSATDAADRSGAQAGNDVGADGAPIGSATREVRP